MAVSGADPGKRCAPAASLAGSESFPPSLLLCRNSAEYRTPEFLTHHRPNGRWVAQFCRFLLAERGLDNLRIPLPVFLGENVYCDKIEVGIRPTGKHAAHEMPVSHLASLNPRLM